MAERVLLYLGSDQLNGGGALPQPVGGGVASGYAFGGKDTRLAKQTNLYAGSGQATLFDPACYRGEFASDGHPFVLPGVDAEGTADQLPIGTADESLTAYLAGQRQRTRLPFALTPTGYLKYGDMAGVESVVRKAGEQADRPETVLVLPLDGRWLSDQSALEHIVGLVKPLRVRPAFVLGGRGNPLARVPAAAGLRYLITSVAGAMLLRADLAGLDALAHGAECCAIGVRPSLRHAAPPDGSGPPPTREGWPATVLHPWLMRFVNVTKLREHYGPRPVPVCRCACCGGRPLDRFPNTKDGIAEAERHNLAVWSPWAAAVQAEPDPRQRQAVWRELCARAVAVREEVNRELGREAFARDPSLETWAGLR